jgi:cardiolipin synthase
MWLNVPNAITLVRIALVPVIVHRLWVGDDQVACWLFAVSAVSDLADGQIARRWGQHTRFGAVADPLADKLTMLAVTVVLTLQGALPWWFTAVVVGRDLVIVGGALAYHWLIGHVEMAPTPISKVNTALQFVLVSGVLAIRAGYVSVGPWWDVLLGTTMATMVLSGALYVREWARRAAQARQAA